MTWISFWQCAIHQACGFPEQERACPGFKGFDALSLDLPAMDDTQREFVDLLAEVETANDETLLTHLRMLSQHARTMHQHSRCTCTTPGNDPVTCIVAMPEALPNSIIHGCGDASCSESKTLEPAAINSIAPCVGSAWTSA